MGPEGGWLETADGAGARFDEYALDAPAAIRLEHYAQRLAEIRAAHPADTLTLLGAVRILTPAPVVGVRLRIPLLSPLPPGSLVSVWRPNATTSAWADTGLSATVGADGRTAWLSAPAPGGYAIANPDAASGGNDTASPETASGGNDAASAETGVASEGRARPRMLPRAAGNWGLISENPPSPNKIPLILVHGDNSFLEPEDRWGNFLDWADRREGFSDRYEIWRFHHDTRLLIGYNGDAGNAAQLGDAIMEHFGPDRPLLLLAHSRGGLVSRSYMSKYGTGRQGDRVLGLITLGTPHHGSPGAVPEWGLVTVKGKFKDTRLAQILYGFTADAVVNVSDAGTMGLAWDNYDGPENGIAYTTFTFDSPLGNAHALSVMDANIPDPAPAGPDGTVYLPDREAGTLAELNADDRYLDKIIAYGGYDTDLGVGGQDPFNWLNLSFNDHAGLTLATQLMANMEARASADNSEDRALIYMANDGMVPLQSALLLEKTAHGEPIFTVDSRTEWFYLEKNIIRLKDLTGLARIRKMVICPDYDHLNLAEGKSGLTSDKADYWNHVGASIDEMAAGNNAPAADRVVTLPTEPTTISTLASGDNCFIGAAAPARAIP